jgi:FAD/FMN-containing dehydrogenase
MTTTTSLNGLESSLRGLLITPESPEYDSARKVWNGMIDRRPSVIAMCEGTADVIASIDFAREAGMPITLRGGGHSVAGKAVADDALLIDLSRMKSVQVDSVNKTARVGAGATWGVVDHETQAFGLAVTGGVDSRTGVGGLTLGGGIGYLGRPFGLTIDHLIGAEVVLADGRTVIANEQEHADLFWALRGGGGNFGVVTTFEYRLNEIGPEVMNAQVFYPMDQAAQALAFYRDFMNTSSDNVGCFALFINTPPVEPFPQEFHGTTCLALVGCHAGSLEDGEMELKPLAEFGSPMLSVLSPISYTALQSSFDAGAPDGGRYYWKAQYLDELSDQAIAILVEEVDPLPGEFSNVFIEPLGGAISMVDPAETAFPHRGVSFGLGISSGWESPSDDERSIAWTRALHEKIRPFATSGVYSNYIDSDDGDRVEATFGQNLKRLQEVKGKYDPDNLFDQANQAIVAG